MCTVRLPRKGPGRMLGAGPGVPRSHSRMLVSMPPETARWSVASTLQTVAVWPFRVALGVWSSSSPAHSEACSSPLQQHQSWCSNLTADGRDGKERRVSEAKGGGERIGGRVAIRVMTLAAQSRSLQEAATHLSHQATGP